MKPELIKHWYDNKKTFEFWIERNERLHYGMDILQPIIPEFEKSKPGTNIKHCQDCIITMLIWLKFQVNKYEKSKE